MALSALSVAAAVAMTAAPAPSSADAAVAVREITFSVHTRGDVAGDVAEFRAVVASTLRDPRGWSLGGSLRFRQVDTGADLRVVLAAPREVDRAAPVCSARYSCQVGDEALINDERWRSATRSWTRSRLDYRHYVLNHEVGHWLGLDHAFCPGRGRPAPVMQQQSISLQGCQATVWPLADELHAVARRFGVRPVAPRARPAVARPAAADLVWIPGRAPARNTMTTSPAPVLAQTEVAGGNLVVLGVISLLAGILILVVPRVLDHVVAAWLIVVGRSSGSSRSCSRRADRELSTTVRRSRRVPGWCGGAAAHARPAAPRLLLPLRPRRHAPARERGVLGPGASGTRAGTEAPAVPLHRPSADDGEAPGEHVDPRGHRPWTR